MASEVELERLVVRLLGDQKSYQAMLKTAQSSTRSATRSIVSTLNTVERKAVETGKVLTAAITLPLVGLGTAATKMSTDLNAAMANVGALGLAPERVRELKTGVQALGVEVGKTTGDIAGGLFQVVSAFGDTADTMEVLRINAKAATAGLATTTDAINLTSAVTKGYGDTSAKAVQKVADLAFVTNKLGQTTFPELASSIGRVIPLAAELQVTQEEVFAVMATGTGVTGNAAEVTTQLRGALQALSSPSADMIKLLKKTGFESGKAVIEQKGLQGAIEFVTREATKSKLPLQRYIGSIEGQTLALALTGSQTDVYKEKLKAMQDASGAAEGAFATQTDTINKLGFAYKKMVVRVQVLAQNIGDVLTPAVLELTKLVDPLLTSVEKLSLRFSRLDPKIQATTLAVIALVSAVGPALFISAKLLGVLIATVKVLAAIVGLMNPWVVGLVAVGAAIAGIVLWLEGSDGLIAAWNNAKQAVMSFVDRSIGFFQNFQENMAIINKWLRNNWKVLLSDLGKNFMNLIQAMVNNASTGVGLLARLFALGAGFIANKLREVFTVRFIRSVMQGLNTALKLVIGFAKAAGTAIAKGLLGEEVLFAPPPEFERALIQGFKADTLEEFSEEVGNIVKGAVQNLQLPKVEFTALPEVNLKRTGPLLPAFPDVPSLLQASPVQKETQSALINRLGQDTSITRLLEEQLLEQQELRGAIETLPVIETAEIP